MNTYQYYYDLAISILPDIKEIYAYEGPNSDNMRKINALETILLAFKSEHPEME
jgi:hypothetical protein